MNPYAEVCLFCNRAYMRRPCENTTHVAKHRAYRVATDQGRRQFRKDTIAMEVRAIPRIAEAPPIISSYEIPEPRKGYAYLASPFWHEDPAIRFKRYREAKEAAATLNRRGRVVLSGVQQVIDGNQAEIRNLQMGESFGWLERALVYLWAASALFILNAIGETVWYNSKGCLAEFKLACERDIPISIVHRKDWSVNQLTPVDRDLLYNQLFSL